MATIKTVANLWKLEKQNKHARDVAKRAGLLYDKFVGFLESMDEIGKALGKASSAHQTAVERLSTGSGHLARSGRKTPQDGHTDQERTPILFFPNHREERGEQEEFTLEGE